MLAGLLRQEHHQPDHRPRQHGRRGEAAEVQPAVGQRLVEEVAHRGAE